MYVETYKPNSRRTACNVSTVLHARESVAYDLLQRIGRGRDSGVVSTEQPRSLSPSDRGCSGPLPDNRGGRGLLFSGRELFTPLKASLPQRTSIGRYRTFRGCLFVRHVCRMVISRGVVRLPIPPGYLPPVRGAPPRHNRSKRRLRTAALCSPCGHLVP